MFYVRNRTAQHSKKLCHGLGSFFFDDSVIVWRFFFVWTSLSLTVRVG